AFVPPTVRYRDDARDDVLGHEDRQLDLAVRRGNPDRVAVADVGGGRVVDVHAHMLGTFATHQQRRVVHPGVLPAGLAPAGAPHGISGGDLPARQRLDLGGDLVVGHPHPATAVDDDLVQYTVAQVRREHLAVRMVGGQPREGQAAAPQPEPVATLAQPDHG